MKIKLSPLNIVSSICLVAGVLLLVSRKPYSREHYVDISGTIAWLCFLAMLVFFVSDLIFRRFIPSLKKLWIIQGALVIFMVILVFIIKSSIN